MDVLITALIKLLETSPLVFLAAFPLVMWYMERNERKTLQKDNIELQDKMINALNDVKSALSTNNMLLQVLTNNRGARRGSR